MLKGSWVTCLAWFPETRTIWHEQRNLQLCSPMPLKNPVYMLGSFITTFYRQYIVYCSFILIYNTLALDCLVLNIRAKKGGKNKLRLNSRIYSLILCHREFRAINRSDLKITIKKNLYHKTYLLLFTI